jgi:molecular chaperone HtpG
MSDSIDNFWPERCDSFEDKKFLAVTQAAGEFGKDETLPDVSVLLSAMKEALGADVSDVRATGRLTDSAVVLAAEDKGPDLHVQRLMRRAGRAIMPSKPILEVNPRHKLIESLVAKQDDRELVKEVAETLLDLAKVQEGEPLKDAAGFARRVSTLLAGSLAG